MDLPVMLRLRPSVILAAVLLFGHGLVATAILPCDLSLASKLVLIGLIGVSGAHTIWRHALRRDGIKALILNRDGKLDLVTAEGMANDTSGALEVVGETMVHRWVVVLRLRAAQRQLTLVLPPDALAGEGHRKLRVWLNWGVSNAALQESA